MKRKIVGEGSYGCVHKPSIHCKNPPTQGFNYDNYVSKIMKTKEAVAELSEFVVMQKFDPTNEYHLGKPIMCDPILSTDVKKDISKCKYIKIAEVEAKPDKYSLLLLKFGGSDLESLGNNLLKKYLKTDKVQRVDTFWLSVHNLIKGIQFFKKHGIVHNDIKPQNILFNLTNGHLRYIDFGIMRTKKEIIDSSEKNNNYLSLYHWSYPFDCGLMNKQQYDNYNHRDSARRTVWKNQLSELIITKSDINTLGLPVHNPKSIKILFTYLNPTHTIPNAATQYGYIDSFFDGFNDLIKTNSYAKVLDHTIDSIDVFGLGFTLQYMANWFKKLNALSLEDYTRLSTFFHKMYDFNPQTRVIDIELLLNEYENILLEIGILTRTRKTFKNNILVNKAPAPPSIMKKAKSDEHSVPKHLSLTLQELADKDATDNIKLTNKCPVDKDYNILTKRCVKQCRAGFSRNAKFQCRKKTQKNKSQ